MSSATHKRKILRLGHKRHSRAIVLPQPLVNYLINRGHDFSDCAEMEIEVNEQDEFVLRLSRSKN